MPKPKKFIFIVTLFFQLCALSVWAQSNIAIVAATKGEAQIFRDPQQLPEGPFVTYEGKKYGIEPAKLARKVRPDEVIHTGVDGRVKIIYPNGDNFVVGPGSSMVMPTDDRDEKEKSSVLLKLFYGKVRSVISKEGPRNKMRVKTSAAVAGVRGTDFFISDTPQAGTRLTVIRGEVAFNSDGATAEPVSIKKGFSAVAPKTGAVEVAEANKEQLAQIQKDSAVKADAKELAELPKEEQAEIKTVSEEAKKSVLVEIQKEDPGLFAQLQKQKNADIETINAASLTKVAGLAPTAIKKKPTREEMESAGKDVYDKYDKSVKPKVK